MTDTEYVRSIAEDGYKLTCERLAQEVRLLRSVLREVAWSPLHAPHEVRNQFYEDTDWADALTSEQMGAVLRALQATSDVTDSRLCPGCQTGAHCNGSVAICECPKHPRGYCDG